MCFCRLPSLSHPSLICAESNLSALQPHPYLPPLCTWGLSAHGGCCYSSFPQLEHSRVPRLHRLSGRGPRRLIPHPPPQVFVHLRPPQSPRPPCTSPQASGSQNQNYSDGNSTSSARNEPSRIEMLFWGLEYMRSADKVPNTSQALKFFNPAFSLTRPSQLRRPSYSVPLSPPHKHTLFTSRTW